MAGTKIPTCPIPQNYTNPAISIANADGACGVTASITPSNRKLLYTASTNDANVKALTAVSDDTAARVLNVYLSPDGTSFYLLGCVNIPITAGTITGTPAVDLLAALPGLPLDASGKPCIPLVAARRLYIGSQVAVTTAKVIVVQACVEEF